jgi:beta-glucosidase
LKAGETKTLTIQVEAEPFAIFDETRNAWVIPPGEYELAIGDSSRNIEQTEKMTVPDSK